VSNASWACPAGLAKEVVSTGRVAVPGGQAEAQVVAVVDRISYPFRWAAFAAIPNNMIPHYELELWLDNDTRAESYDSRNGPYDSMNNRGVAGHLGANGDIRLDTGVDVLGNVWAGDAVSAGAGVHISGTTSRNLAPDADSRGEPFPVVTPPLASTSSCSYPEGSTTALATGTYYCTTLHLGSGARLVPESGASVTLYVTGDVTLGNNVTLGEHPPTQLRIIAQSNGAWSSFNTFSAGKNLQFSGLLYGRNTNIALGSGAVVHGSIIGRTVHVGASSRLRHDQAAIDRELCHGGTYAVRRGTWREVLP